MDDTSASKTSIASTNPDHSSIDVPSAVTKNTGRFFNTKTVVAVAYVAAVFMSAMDTHIVNTMLPHLSKQFHSPLTSVEWTSISYNLSLAVFIPSSGWLGDRFGNKRMFLIALFIFTAASAACGQAQNLPQLVGARFVQGAGGGMLTPVGTAMLFRAFPPAERARVVRILTVPILLGPVIAQPIGGLLVTKASWRWSFYLNVPIGIFALIIGMLYLVEYRQPRADRLDWKGFVLAGAGLSTLLYSVSQGPIKGWTSSDVAITGVVGVVSLVIFVLIEFRQKSPMLNLRLLAENRLFRATNLVNIASSAAFLGGLIYLGTIFLQEAKGQSALDAGLTTFAVSFGVIISSQTVGRLYPKLGPRRMIGFGSLAFALMLSSFLLIGVSTNLWVVRVLFFFAGATNSATGIAVQTSMYATISSADTGHAAAINRTLSQTATTMCIALVTLVLTVVHGSRIDAFHDAFLTIAGIALLGSFLSFRFINDNDALETMRPRGARARKESVLVTD